MSQIAQIKKGLRPFDFDETIIQGFRDSKQIPLNFYNREGQIIINKKEEASPTEIEGLLRFASRGIFFHEEDSDKLATGKKKDERKVPGFSDTEVISQKTADTLSSEINGVFKKLKMSSMTTIQASSANQKMLGVIQDFHNQPEAMFGLVNILDLMQDKELSYEVDIAVKRTVIAMSLKMRSLNSRNSRIANSDEQEMASLMTASLLCDVSYAKMEIPRTDALTPRQMDYIKHHPIYSYFLLAHDRHLPSEVKQMILLHHSPLLNKKLNNNYPSLSTIFDKFDHMKKKIGSNTTRAVLLGDMNAQMSKIKKGNYNVENLGILNLSGEFASLTSKVPWRKALSPDLAIRMIINNSFFGHHRQILVEFIDHLAVSLNRNKPVLDEGDFIIVMARGNDGKQYFEVCMVKYMDRLQSRPGVMRLGFIKPKVSRSPRLKITGLDPGSLKLDPRRAVFRMDRDESRSIVYVIDERLDPDMHQRLLEITS